MDKPKLVGIHKANIEITVETGLMIGGISEVKIGGLDNPVIKVKKRTDNGVVEIPYIPGSSLKGKTRFLLEMKYKETEKMKTINKLFGLSQAEENENYITRAIFRDLYPEKFENITEIKPENTIEIKKGILSAKPRFMERIVPGTKFTGEIIINEFEGDKIDEFKELIEEGLKLLQNNYLGGSGTRGYGKVKVGEMNWKKVMEWSAW